MSGRDTVLLVGTRKGLWIGRSDAAREDWSWTGPHFDMEEVYSCMVDTRGDRPRLLVGASSSWLGPRVRRSEDLGETWEESPDGGIRFPEDRRERRAGLAARPRRPRRDRLRRSEPGAVWRSDDAGATYHLEQALWDHPHRPQWAAGFGGQAFHTILPHPTDPDR